MLQIFLLGNKFVQLQHKKYFALDAFVLFILWKFQRRSCPPALKRCLLALNDSTLALNSRPLTFISCPLESTLPQDLLPAEAIHMTVYCLKICCPREVSARQYTGLKFAVHVSCPLDSILRLDLQSTGDVRQIVHCLKIRCPLELSAKWNIALRFAVHGSYPLGGTLP